MQEILSKKTLGERIKSLRKEKSHSQSHVADLLNLSRSNYSQIELGNQYPTFITLHTLSRYYNKSYDWLLHGAGCTEETNTENDVPILVNELESSLKSFARSLKDLESEMQNIKRKITAIQ